VLAVVVTNNKRFSEDYLATFWLVKSADDFTAASIAINHEKALRLLES
jgi:hypothetical protein